MRQAIFTRSQNALAACGPEVAGYLENKYGGEKFAIVGARGESWGAPADRFLVKPVNATDSDETFAVFCSSYAGGCSFADAYYSVLIKPDYERFIQNFLNDILPSYTLTLQLNRESPNPDGLTRQVPVTDIHKHVQPGGPLFAANIRVLATESALKGKNPADVHAAIVQKLSEAKLTAWIKLYSVSDVYAPSDAPPSGDVFFGCVNRAYQCKRFTMQTETTSIADASDGLSDWQLERLCSLVYLDGLLLHRDEGTLGEITEFLLEYGLEDCKIGDLLPCEMTVAEWRRVLLDIKNDAALRMLRVIKSVDVTVARDGILPGHRAVCFADGAGNAYAVFRGTCGDEEWYDNALGMTQADTPQQQASARFVEEIRRDPRVARVVTAGHSKGGNKAQYAAIATPEGFVNRCFSLDGQGFSQAFLDKYTEAIASRKENIRLIAERRDFVNCLGLYLTEGTKYYIGRRGDPLPGGPHGQPLPYFHCPDALRDAAGRIGSTSEMKPIPDTLSALVSCFLLDPKYAEQREDTAVDLISVLMKNKKASTEETAEAIANLAVVFMDLVSRSETFRDHAEDIFFHEADVLLATFASVETSEASDEADASGGLLKGVAECMARRIVTDPEVRKNFAVTLKQVVLLVKKLLNATGTEKKLLDHIFMFVESLLKRLAGTWANKAVQRVLPCWRILTGRTRMRFASEPDNDDSDFSVLLSHLDGWAKEE